MSPAISLHGSVLVEDEAPVTSESESASADVVGVALVVVVLDSSSSSCEWQYYPDRRSL
jgi:hypothetical protein